MANVVQRSFAGGELAPALYARTDQVKYATGVRTCRNFLVMRHGGVANRPGTVFVGATKNASDPVRLIRFAFNADQTYVLEFGHHYIRFFRAGGRVVVSGVAAWVTGTDYAVADLVSNGGVNYYCTAAHTAGATTEPGVGADWLGRWSALEGAIYEIPSPYDAADLAGIQLVQSADVITLVHPSYAPRELSRTDHTRWLLTAIPFGPSIGEVTGLLLSGGSAGAETFWAVTAVDALTGEEGLAAVISASDKVPSAATPTTISWSPVAGAIEYRIYRSPDGSTYGLIGTAGGTSQPTSDTTWTSTTSTANTATKETWKSAGTGASNPVVATIADKSFNNTYTCKGTLTLSAAGSGVVVQGRIRAYYSRNSEPRVDAGIVGDAAVFAEGGSGDIPFSGAVTVPDNGYTTLTIELVPEVWGNTDTGPIGASCTVNATSIDYAKIGTGFSDAGLAPDFASAPPTDRELFAAAGAYPSTVTYYQQRRIFGNSTADPEKVWASRTGLFRNFLSSTPIQDDDPIIFTLAGRQVNAVRHLLDLGRLVIFTTGGEWSVEGDDAGILRAGAVNPRQYSYNGSAALPPIIVDSSALYVQARGTIVRDLANDAIEGYKGNDLTIFAAHLFDQFSLLDWDYQQIPHSIVWAVRSDGVLLGLTYIKDQQVWGWHRHDTAGTIENVCVVPEGAEDRVYLVVRRTVNGATVRYVEQLASRQFIDIRDAIFVDAALSYDGRNTDPTKTMTLSGGVTWEYDETLTLTASAAGTFVAGDVGNAILLTDADGEALRVTIDAFTSDTIVTGRASRTVPASLQGVATASWAKAVDQLSGLDHLEGAAVSVLGDGFVLASPNNSDYAEVTVSGGAVTLDQPYAVIHVGLPYRSDLETLDIDTPQGASLKDKKMLVNRVGLFVQASRGVFAGSRAPSGDDPLDGLQEYKPRDTEVDPDAPPALITDAIDLTLDASWNSNGRVFIRQVDPLPLSVLSVTPQGYLPVPP